VLIFGAAALLNLASLHRVCMRWARASIAWYIARGDSAGCHQNALLDRNSMPPSSSVSRLMSLKIDCLGELSTCCAYAAVPRSRTWSLRLLTAHFSEAPPCSPLTHRGDVGINGGMIAGLTKGKDDIVLDRASRARLPAWRRR